MLEKLFLSKGGKSNKKELSEKTLKLIDIIKNDPSLNLLKTENINLFNVISSFRDNINPKGGIIGEILPCSYLVNKRAVIISEKINDILGLKHYREYPREFFINPNDYKR